jgi:hypothetical protein
MSPTGKTAPSAAYAACFADSSCRGARARGSRRVAFQAVIHGLSAAPGVPVHDVPAALPDGPVHDVPDVPPAGPVHDAPAWKPFGRVHYVPDWLAGSMRAALYLVATELRGGSAVPDGLILRRPDAALPMFRDAAVCAGQPLEVAQGACGT